MSRLDLSAMFLLGLLGTGHCIAMCGPLVFAFPGRSGKLMPHVLYHLGRLATYSMMGGLLGGLGACLTGLAVSDKPVYLSWTSVAQILFSLIAAVFLVVFGLARLGILRDPALMSMAVPAKIPGFRWVMNAVVQRERLPGFFLLGLILGFLPCGLSYAAFARALPAGSTLSGVAMLASFGFGTVPGLILMGSAASGLMRRYSRYSDILAGMTMIAMAASLAADALQAFFA